MLKVLVFAMRDMVDQQVIKILHVKHAYREHGKLI
jgi:hypothetical protein